MRCTLCEIGETEHGFVTVTLERENSIVVIKNVPANICPNCGHYFLSEKITGLVLEKANEALSNGAELEVFSLKVA